MQRLIPEKIIPEKRVYRLILVLLSWGLAIAPAICPLMAQEPPVRSVEEAPPLPRFSGNSRDLRQLEQRPSRDWQWQNVLLESQKNFNPPTLRYKSAPKSANPNQGFEDWERLNQGDPKRGSPSFPITTF